MLVDTIRTRVRCQASLDWVSQRSVARERHQTAMVWVSLRSATCGDARGLDPRLRCIPHMSHTLRIGLGSRTISLGMMVAATSQLAAREPVTKRNVARRWMCSALLVTRHCPSATVVDKLRTSYCSSTGVRDDVQSGNSLAAIDGPSIPAEEPSRLQLQPRVRYPRGDQELPRGSRSSNVPGKRGDSSNKEPNPSLWAGEFTA